MSDTTDPVDHCEQCGSTHPSNAAGAVGRYSPTGPLGFVADFPEAPLRATRTESVRDWCDHRRAKRDNPPPLDTPAPPPRPVVQVREPKPDPAPFPSVRMEVLCREKAWRDFLTNVAFSLQVWELDADVRAEVEHPCVWLRRLGGQLTSMGMAS